MVFQNTRNYGPPGLRCSLRLQGDIIYIMYRFWPPKFEQREIQKHDIKQKGPKIFPLKTIIIIQIYSDPDIRMGPGPSGVHQVVKGSH